MGFGRFVVHYICNSHYSLEDVDITGWFSRSWNEV